MRLDGKKDIQSVKSAWSIFIQSTLYPISERIIKDVNWTQTNTRWGFVFSKLIKTSVTIYPNCMHFIWQWEVPCQYIQMFQVIQILQVMTAAKKLSLFCTFCKFQSSKGGSNENTVIIKKLNMKIFRNDFSQFVFSFYWKERFVRFSNLRETCNLLRSC